MAQAYLFDLDGTLIDSEAAHKTAEVVTLGSFGLDLGVDDLFRFTGVPYATMLGELEKAYGVHLPLEDFFERHKPTLLAKIGSEILLFADVEDCLARLNGAPMAIATSSPGWYVNAVINAFPTLRAFTKFVCADDVTQGKPAPEAFLLAAQAVGRSPGECMAVEDSANGVASAKAAGCYTVGVRRDPRLDLSQADLLVESLAEIGEGFPGVACG